MMNTKSRKPPKTWSDPDDAPELTAEFFEKGEWKIGDKVVSREEVRAALEMRRGRPVGLRTGAGKGGRGN